MSQISALQRSGATGCSKHMAPALEVEQRSPQTSHGGCCGAGSVVLGVKRGSAAAHAGVEPQSTILAVGGQPVASKAELLRCLSEDQPAAGRPSSPAAADLPPPPGTAATATTPTAAVVELQLQPPPPPVAVVRLDPAATSVLVCLRASISIPLLRLLCLYLCPSLCLGLCFCVSMHLSVSLSICVSVCLSVSASCLSTSLSLGL